MRWRISAPPILSWCRRACPVPRCAARTLPDALSEARDRPIDVDAGEIGGLALWQFAEGTHALQIRLHHASSDGWGLELFARELGKFYRQRVEGCAAPPPQSRSDADVEMPAARPLDAAFPNLTACAPTGFAMRRDIALPADLAKALTRTARAMRCTLYPLFTAAVALAIREMFGGDRVGLGTLITGRRDRASMERIEPWYQTGILAVNVSTAGTFEVLVDALIDAQDALMEAPVVPYDALRLVNDLPPAPPVMVQFDRFPFAGLQLLGAKVTGLIVNREADAQGEVRVPHASQAALTFFLRIAPEGLTLSVFRQEGLDRDVSDALTAGMLGVLQAMVADPTRPLHAIVPASMPALAKRPVMEPNTGWSPVDLCSPAGDLSAWGERTR